MIDVFLELFNRHVKIGRLEDRNLGVRKDIRIMEFLDWKRTPEKIILERKKILNEIDKLENKFYSKKSNKDKDIYDEPEYNQLEIKLSEVEKKFTIYEDLYGYVSTDSITSFFNEISLIETYDAYGSGLYKYQDTEFYLFDNYGDSDCDRVPFKIFTPYIIIKKTNQIQIADINLNPETKQFYLTNQLTGEFPKTLLKYKIKTFCGKRTFYYEPENKCVTMRCPETIYDKYIPKKYKAEEQYRTNISGTRIKIPLKN